jgi:pathogenesis-related protein 1
VRRIACLLVFVWPLFSQTALPEDWLREHNAIRARLHEQPLVWSDELAEAARHWADTLINSRSLRHDGDHTHGQNIFAITRGSATVAFVVHAWAEEASSYDYTQNVCTAMCGHYTQLVWRDTREVGCAVASRRGREIWVCDYSPPGNVVGQRPY